MIKQIGSEDRSLGLRDRNGQIAASQDAVGGVIVRRMPQFLKLDEGDGKRLQRPVGGERKPPELILGASMVERAVDAPPSLRSPS